MLVVRTDDWKIRTRNDERRKREMGGISTIADREKGTDDERRKGKKGGN